MFHSHEPGILDLHVSKDIAIKDTVEKCGSMMWLDFNLLGVTQLKCKWVERDMHAPRL